MKKKHAWLAALLNFILLGVGTIYNGKRVLVGVLLTIGAIGSTYVELQMKEAAPELYNYAFASFFILAVAMTIDAYKEAKSINSSQQ
jgi:hypothetical protein